MNRFTALAYYSAVRGNRIVQTDNVHHAVGHHNERSAACRNNGYSAFDRRFNGSLRLCDFLNIGMENVCASGNADNDADMIAESGLGAAVENASQKCLDRADIVIPSNNNDGVAQLIEKILKN